MVQERAAVNEANAHIGESKKSPSEEHSNERDVYVLEADDERNKRSQQENAAAKHSQRGYHEHCAVLVRKVPDGWVDQEQNPTEEMVRCDRGGDYDHSDGVRALVSVRYIRPQVRPGVHKCGHCNGQCAEDGEIEAPVSPIAVEMVGLALETRVLGQAGNSDGCQAIGGIVSILFCGCHRKYRGTCRRMLCDQTT